MLLQILIGTGLLSSVIGIPAALVDAVAAFLLAVGGAAALYGLGNAIAKDALGSFGTLLQLQDGNSVFDNGHWSKVASDPSDPGWHFKV